MIERLIAAICLIPAFIYCGVDFESKKADSIIRVVAGVLLFLLGCYLGVVLPQ